MSDQRHNLSAVRRVHAPPQVRSSSRTTPRCASTCSRPRAASASRRGSRRRVPKVVVDGTSMRDPPNAAKVATDGRGWRVRRQAYDFWMEKLAALLAAGGAKGAALRLIPDHTVHRCVRRPAPRAPRPSPRSRAAADDPRVRPRRSNSFSGPCATPRSESSPPGAAEAPDGPGPPGALKRPRRYP